MSHISLLRTLTRLFTALTADKPSLTREAVTPNLPTIFSALINYITTPDQAPELLLCALESTRDLIFAHPVTARPHATKLRNAVLGLLATSPDAPTERLARELYVTLHLTASGNKKRPTIASSGAETKISAPASEWTSLFLGAIQAAHTQLDTIFTPIIEDADYRNSAAVPIPADDIPSDLTLSQLLRLIRTFFLLPTPHQVAIPIPGLLDLTSRILAVTPASQANPAIESAIRESLITSLPRYHSLTLTLLTTTLNRLQSRALPFLPTLLEQLTYVFTETGKTDSALRNKAYTFLNVALNIAGPAFAKSTVDSLTPILSGLCADLAPQERVKPVNAQEDVKKGGKARKASEMKTTGHADALMNGSAAPVSAIPFSPVVSKSPTAPAAKLLPTVLRSLNPNHVRAELHSRILRAAVLTRNQEALMAGVLWPRLDARGTVVPHLVKCSGSNGMAVEGLVRPRLPVVWTGDRERKRCANDDDEEEEEDEDENDEEEEQEDVDMEAEVVKELNDAPDSKRRRLSKEEPMVSGSAPVILNSGKTQGVLAGSTAEALQMSEKEKAEYPALYPVLPNSVEEPVVKAPVVKSQPQTVVTKKTEVKKVERKVQQDVKMANAEDSDDDDVEIVIGEDSDEESDSE